MKYNKKFLVIGNKNAVTYKEIFPLIMQNKIWFGVTMHSGGIMLRVPDYYDKSQNFIYDEEGHKYVNTPGPRWFTNLEHDRRKRKMILYRKYDPEKYPKYDNYDAINVDKTDDIPYDYDGVMGVPITFLDKFSPEQFEILGCTESEGKGFSNGLWIAESSVAQPMIKGKKIYKRIFIKRK